MKILKGFGISILILILIILCLISLPFCRTPLFLDTITDLTNNLKGVENGK